MSKSKLSLNSTCFGVAVAIQSSGETGIVTGFAQHQRSKAKQFFVEYRGNDGCYREAWFFEDQLSVL